VFLRLRIQWLRLRCRDGGTGDGRDGRSEQQRAEELAVVHIRTPADGAEPAPVS
jgi:hypothetical protein